jgi:hypothetical protein
MALSAAFTVRRSALQNALATLIPCKEAAPPIFIRHTATNPGFIGVSGIFDPQQIRNLWRVKILAFPFISRICGGVAL